MDVRAGPLSLIYQMSWDSGEGPAGWEPASVILIYTKGVKKYPETYRPVGLISLPRKNYGQGDMDTCKEECIHQAQSAWAHKGKVLFNKFNILP